jgi:hypothetical protein
LFRKLTFRMFVLVSNFVLRISNFQMIEDI